MSTTETISTSDLREEYTQFVGRKVLFIIVSLAGIAVLAEVAAILGSANITRVEVYSAILARFFPGHFATTNFIDTIVWQLRHLLLTSRLVGTQILLGADIVARTILAPVILPVWIS